MSCRKKDSSNIPRANHQTPRQPTSGSWNAQPHSEQYQGPQKSKNQDLSTFSSKFQNPGFSYNGKTWIRQDDGSPAYPQPQNTFSDQNRKQNLIKIGKDEIDTTYFTRDELNLFLRDNLSQRNQFISKTEHQLRNLRDAIDLKTTGIAEAGQQMADILKYLEMLEMNELLLKSESEGFSETGRCSSSLANTQPNVLHDSVPFNGYRNVHIAYQQTVMTPIEQQVPQLSYSRWNPSFGNMQPAGYYSVPGAVDGSYYDPYQQAGPSQMHQQVPYQNDLPVTGHWTGVENDSFQNYSESQCKRPPVTVFSSQDVRNDGYFQKEVDKKETIRIPSKGSNQNAHLAFKNVRPVFQNGADSSELAFGFESRKSPATTISQLQLPQVIETPPTPIDTTYPMNLFDERNVVSITESTTETENKSVSINELELTYFATTNLNLSTPQIIETPATPIDITNPAGQLFSESDTSTGSLTNEKSVKPIEMDLFESSVVQTENGTNSEQGTEIAAEQSEAIDLVSTNSHLPAPQIIETPPTPISRENPENHVFQASEPATTVKNSFDSRNPPNIVKLVLRDRIPEIETGNVTQPQEITDNEKEYESSNPDAVVTNAHLSSPQIIETPPTPITRESSEHQVFLTRSNIRKQLSL